jgi:hypothetical protein
MHTIPLTIVDDFFDDPNAIRNFALSQEFSPDPTGQWPGVRTQSLHLIDNDIFDIFTKKYFSLFFPVEKIGWSVDARFQKIGKHYGEGWAHNDVGPIITGIVYLNPTPAPNSGTVLLDKRSLRSNSRLNDKQTDKIAFYKNQASKEEVELFRQRNNNEFTDSVIVNAKYNRLVTFDSHLIHKAQDFYGDNNDERLTLVFFVQDVTTANTPIYRSRCHIL